MIVTVASLEAGLIGVELSVQSPSFAVYLKLSDPSKSVVGAKVNEPSKGSPTCKVWPCDVSVPLNGAIVRTAFKGANVVALILVSSFHVGTAQTLTSPPPGFGPTLMQMGGKVLHEGDFEPLVHAPVKYAGNVGLLQLSLFMQAVQNGGFGAS